MNTSQVMTEIEGKCRSRGLRLTPTRRRVLELVMAADGPVKAYDLLDDLKRERPGAAPPTIYRALDFLLENHFIHRLETLNAFVSCIHPQHQHQGQFLICEQCQTVLEIHDHDLADALTETARRHGFSAKHQVLEIYGLCQACGDSPD
ncbi:MAG: transcriptional repressor [Wenzhouxiangella sp.]|nr:MAG: transcriptional repressor [Wenzhouxiangella sp.]